MVFIFALLILLMLLVIWFDATRFLIPNWLVGLLLLAWPAMLFLTPEHVAWKPALAAGFVTFAAGYIIYIFKWMGGGDVKLLAVCALWAGWPGVLPLVVYMAIFGGLLTLALLAARAGLPHLPARLQPKTLPRLLQPKAPVPYGLAIAASFLVLLIGQQLPGVSLK